jgi:EmrB/QacA subfamily drug resistance transporter
MSNEAIAPRGFRLRDMIRHGAEPPPVGFVIGKPWYPWLIVGVTCIGAFIGQLDASIVQLALPALGRVFAARLSSVSWVSLAYLLAFASSLPISSRLCEMFGRKLLYLIGFLLFAMASALCGAAGSLGWLIAFRVAQGIGGGMLGANSVSILVKAVDPAQRARAMGIFAAAQAVGVSAGPVVGGLLLGALGWRWVFWVAVPFGAAAAVLGWLVLPQTVGLARGKTFDWRGALLLAPALTLLVMALNQVTSWGPTSPALLGAVAVGLVLLALLVRQERGLDSPLVNLWLLREKAYAGGIVAVVMGYAMLYGMFFMMSFALVRGYHDSPQAAGLRLAIIPVAIGIVAPFSGALANRVGARLLAVAGMAVCLAALLLMALVADDPGAGRLLGMAAMALFGTGLGLFIAPNNTATVDAVPAAYSGEAGGMLNLMRVIGTSLGVAGASAVLAWRLQAMTGSSDDRAVFTGQPIMDAVESSLVMLAAFALIAAVASLVRSAPAPQRAG